jgi:predicted transcriptional regulator
MRLLWERGEATVAEVHTALHEERGLAPTTIATMLVKMEKKGVVAHRAEGRRFVYRPTVTEPEVTRTMVGQLARHLFGGSATALASHLIAEHEIEADELARLKRLIEEREGES